MRDAEKFANVKKRQLSDLINPGRCAASFLIIAATGASTSFASAPTPFDSVPKIFPVTCSQPGYPSKEPASGSYLFGIEAAAQCRFPQPSIGSQKNAALWSVFAPLQGRRQLK
jgi:hypothetical protein